MTALVAIVAVLAPPLTGCGTAPPPAAAPPASESDAPPTTAPAETPLPVVAPAADLPVIDYWPSPTGFPADANPLSTRRVTEGLVPAERIAVYDAAGGIPQAYLDPTIRGVPLTLPIVEHRSGWVSVLLPSVNRTVGWIPPGPWTTVALRDQLFVVRSTHELLWFRDGAFVQSWSVSLGIDATPTPLGRTFVLGRSSLPGYVYADTDVFALGAVPDHPDAVPAGLLGAHIGLHTWYHDGELGQNTTDGCIRLTRSGQEELLTEIAPGTSVVVVESRGKLRP
jgi:L,D-transpeptidase catalytic domain